MAAIPSSEPLFVPDSHPYGFQGAAVPVDSAVTLLVKHLPEAIPQDTLTRLFSHYGASAVRPCSSGRLKNCAFVDFRNDSQAHQAQRQLNGLRFLGKVLVVDRANSSTKVNELQHGRHRSADETTTLPKTTVTTTDIGDKLNAGSGSTKEPIAPKLGIDYPFPPHLEYAYPPPDGNILTNIVNALIAVPHFYTQVLHLMNKMNIPAPFRAALPTPPLPSAPPPAPCAPSTAQPSAADLSESESEMESSEEDGGDEHEVSELSRVGRHGKKRKRGEAIVGPAVDKGVTHEAVGLKPATLLPKEIPLIKKNNPILQIKITPKSSKAEEKDDADDNPEKEKSNNESFASPEELEKGKLPLEEILSLPKFKNYTAGNPATVLYMKNLAKDVIQDDFYFIFGSLFGSIDGAKTNLTVKLMQEGRMRGQAFVTFPSIELARNALDCLDDDIDELDGLLMQNMVNGYRDPIDKCKLRYCLRNVTGVIDFEIAEQGAAIVALPTS